MPTDMPFPTLLVAAAFAALVVGFLKTSIGGGTGLVLTPTLSLILPPQVVLALTAPLMNLSDPISLRYFWRRWDGRQLRVLLPTMVAGVVVGTWAVSILSEAALKRAIGATALAFAIVQLVLSGRRRSLFGADPPYSAGAGTGLVAGVASSVAHSGGVILGLYFVSTPLSPTGIVATGTAIVAVTNLVKLGGYWEIGFLTGRILLAAVIATPALVLGAWLGFRVNQSLPRRAFELVLIAIAIAGSIKLLLG